jgi:Leucine-rich repeat (LRR) protein
LQNLLIDPLSQIGVYAIQNGSARRFRLVSRTCYQAIEAASERIIGIVKTQSICDNIPISIKFRVAQLLRPQLLGETNNGSHLVQLLNIVYQTYRKYGAVITPKRLPITEGDFRELEHQCDIKKRGDSLREIWKEVKRQLALQIELENPDEISTWLNDPSNQSTINSIRDLSLSCRNLRFIPDEIYNFQNLQILCLNGNEITEIPPGISKLSQLRTLLLHNNKISFFPAEICELKELRKLSFHTNNTDEIPKEITKLTNLQKLCFSDKQVDQIPDDTLIVLRSNSLFAIETDFDRSLLTIDLY